MTRVAVYVINGPMAAGKSTVARLLAQRSTRGAHLESDVFRRSVVRDRRETTPGADSEAMRQLRLRYRLSVMAADHYADASFIVAIDDIVGLAMLGDYRMSIRTRPCNVFVLFPSVQAIAEREAGRDETGYWSWRVKERHDMFAGEPRVGVWLDTSALTVGQTVDSILAATPPALGAIVVCEYDPTWPELFERLAAPLRDAVAVVGGYVEHVGSAGVPRLLR